MLEYKREKSALETKLQDLEKKSIDHDDHIRVIDAWVLQLLQEIELLVTSEAKSSSYPGTVTQSVHREHFSDNGRTNIEICAFV
jgi:E3 ubiquitin-protein ligase BRE1